MDGSALLQFDQNTTLDIGSSIATHSRMLLQILSARGPHRRGQCQDNSYQGNANHHGYGWIFPFLEHHNIISP